jgi:hypothetical protein
MALSKLLKRAASALGYSITREAELTEVMALLERLQPQDCSRPLIRIGGERDGGYLVPDDLEGIRYCFSPGVNVTADFEQHLASLNIRSFLADYSVPGPPMQKPEFVFDKRFLGVTDREPFITLQSWKDKYLRDYDGELLLQMDIEGAEYEVMLCTPRDLLRRFRIMVIECHGLDCIFEPYALRLYRACFDKLLSEFMVVHAHPNNCTGSLRHGDLEIPSVIEFTFYNRARVTQHTPQRVFPHPLDTDNCAGLPPMDLPKLWRRAGT